METVHDWNEKIMTLIEKLKKIGESLNQAIIKEYGNEMHWPFDQNNWGNDKFGLTQYVFRGFWDFHRGDTAEWEKASTWWSFFSNTKLLWGPVALQP